MDLTQVFQLVVMFLCAVGFSFSIAAAPHFYPDEGARFWRHVILGGLNLLMFVFNAIFFALRFVGGG